MTHDPQMVERVIAHVQGMDTPKSDDLRRRYTLAQMEVAIRFVAKAALEASHHAELRRIYVTASTVCYNATDESRPDGMILVEPDDWKALNDALDALEEAEAEEEECLAKIGGGQ